MGRFPPTNSFRVFDGVIWKRVLSVQDLETCIQQAKLSFHKDLRSEDKSLISKLKQLKNLKSITIQIQRVNNTIISQQLQSIATALSSSVSLTNLDINLSYYCVDKRQVASAILKCLKLPNLSSLCLSFNQISDDILSDLVSRIEKMKNLTTLKIKTVQEQNKENLFKSLKGMQYLEVLKVNMRSSVSAALNFTQQKSTNLILPECQQLKLSLEDFQFFSSFKENSNLNYLHFIFDNNITPELLSQILVNQIPNLLTVEKLALNFYHCTTELIDFSCRSIQLMTKLNSLKLIFYRNDQVDFLKIFSSVENNQAITNLSIKLIGCSPFIFSEINVSTFKNIRNLEFNGLLESFEDEEDEQSEQFIKKLRRLDSLITLKVNDFTDEMKEVLKSKRLVMLYCDFN